MNRLMPRALMAGCAAVMLAACHGSSSQAPAASQVRAGAPAFHKLGDGVVVDVSHGAARRLRLTVVGPDIVHVTAIPGTGFDTLPKSLMALHTGGDKDFAVKQTQGHVRLSTARLTVDVAVDGGRVRFFDPEGHLILAARKDGITFTPEKVQGKSFYAVRQQFDSPQDEAFYGLGQHQQGTMNYKGRDVELAQHNMDIAIPFVVSSRNYGVLWDNNSITRFGDPRPYQFTGKASPHLQLFDAQGKPGGFTATYYVKGRVALRRDESRIDYQYLGDQDKYPKGLSSSKVDKVVWQGSVASDVAGAHKFRIYASGYTKVYVDGKQILDYWRQNWNPWYRPFHIAMKPGQKHTIRIVWQPQGGYIALDHLDPLPQREQDELSLYSEVGRSVNYYFIRGNDLHQVIAGYRQVTGKSVMLPRWAYGFWQSRDHYMTSAQVLGTVEKYRKLGLPLDNIVQDWRYWKDPEWGSHEFDRSRYPHPRKMIEKIHALHAHFMISVWPKFYATTKNFKELAAKGYMYMQAVKEEVKDWVGPGYVGSFYDPYSEQARQMYWRQINDHLGKLGVDAWWMDATEPDIESNTTIAERERLMGPTTIGPAAEYFNTYPLMTTTAVYQGSRKAYPDRRVFILTRSAFAGQQRNAAASWSGDVASRWRDLRDQISAGVNFSMSGIPNWTTDIGGYQPPARYLKPTAADRAEWRELNLRWFQFGAFCPLFRSHGQVPHREIYNLSPPGTPIYRDLARFDKLRYRLMPYIYTLAADTWLHDGTIMRGLVMDFPSDPKVRDINDEYLFGPAFLVAPVTHYKARSRAVYLPRGAEWYDFYTGKREQGGQTVTASAPLSKMPLFVRAGSIVPVGPAIQYTHEKPDAPITLYVYTGADGSFTLYDDQGTTYDYVHGAYAQIPIHYDQARGVLTIGQRKGSYKGMPVTRRFQVRWISGPTPDATNFDARAATSVVYTGQPASVRRATVHR